MAFTTAVVEDVTLERTLALLGETETEIAAGGLTETAALAYFVVSAELIAFTVTVVVAVTAGAVN